MLERKFAVIRILGNREEVMKLFPDQEEAMAFGASLRNREGVLACIRGLFDGEGRRENTCRVLEVWDSPQGRGEIVEK